VSNAIDACCLLMPACNIINSMISKTESLVVKFLLFTFDVSTGSIHKMMPQFLGKIEGRRWKVEG
jgi:hypothetical protein